MKFKLSLMLVSAAILFIVLLSDYSLKYTYATDAVGNKSDKNASIVDNSEINPLLYGAKGDGITDDTINLQKAFTTCSKRGLTCRIPDGKKFYITSPVFLWGKAKLKGNAGKGSIIFNVRRSPYLLNIGISGRNNLEKPFTGIISGVRFEVIGGKGGRVIFLWRTEGAHIINNIFDVGKYAYSATSSGNDNNWVKNGFQNTVRKNITIIGNKIIATSDNKGSEGIGLGHFDGAQIRWNSIIGVGDDPIGIHFSKNVKIQNNVMKSVDGRLFVVNSKNVEINHNELHRMSSPVDNKFYKGISLLYIGFEQLNVKNNYSAPTDIYIHNNYLYYPPGAIDAGAAMYIYGPRNVVAEQNTVVNDSRHVIASGMHLLPAPFSAHWKDPDRIDSDNLARVHDVTLSKNNLRGKFPQKIIMTGQCVNYVGKVLIKNNLASEYQLYCPKVQLKGNRKHDKNM